MDPSSSSGNFSPTPRSPTERYTERGLHDRGLSYHSRGGLSSSTDERDERIPPNRPGDRRTIVLCFDGTLQEVGARSSNVVELFSLLAKDEPDKRQLTYYDSGIGTTNGEGAPPSKISKVIDAWIARTVPKHIKRGYKFLVENYNRDDKICLFGFSRGAYIARALAGMLCKVGLLPRGSDKHKINQAYEKYARKDEEGWLNSLMQQNASIKVHVDFLGVWDTVASVGFPPTYLPFTRRNPAVHVFRHAVALDERRISFSPYLYQSEPCEAMNEEDRLETEFYKEYQKLYKYLRPSGMDTMKKDPFTQGEPEVDYTDHLEVWFSGCHSDVGGSLKHKRKHTYQLGRIPLFWMIRQCFLANVGIQFDVRKLGQLAFPQDEEPDFPADILFPTVMALPKHPNSAHSHVIESLLHEYFESEHSKLDKTLVQKFTTPPQPDVANPSSNPPLADVTPNVLTRLYHLVRYEIDHALHGNMNDALKKKRLWRMMEQFPVLAQEHEGTSKNVLRRNRGQGRVIRYRDGKNVKVHYTVAMRMHTPSSTYVPRARYDKHDKNFPHDGVEWMEWHHDSTTASVPGRIYSRLLSKFKK